MCLKKIQLLVKQLLLNVFKFSKIFSMKKYITVSNPTPLYASIGGKWEFKYNLNPKVVLNAVEAKIIMNNKKYSVILFRTEKYTRAAVMLKDVKMLKIKFAASGRDVKVTLEQYPGGACRVKKALQGFDNELEPTQEKLFFGLDKSKENGNENGSGLNPLIIDSFNLPLNEIRDNDLSIITEPPPIRYTPPASEIGGESLTEEPPTTPADNQYIAPPIDISGMMGGGGGGGTAPIEEPPTTTTPPKIPFYKNKYFMGGSVIAAIAATFFIARYYTKKAITKKGK